MANPYNNTDIYTIEYTWTHGSSQAQIRYDSSKDTLADVRAFWNAFLNALAPVIDSGFTITAARNQVRGTDFSLPVVPPTGFIGGGTSADEVDRPLYLRFQARSIAGGPVSVTLFGVNLTVPSDYRLNRGESVTIDAALDYLQGAGGPPDITPVAADNEAVVWYDYANVGINAYWTKQARR